ncbi:hypothetical protein AB0387_33690 [Streptomyces sp. NPDC089173]|uniref:hypothetical protein n=1 Tax=Streptomyces sp. NPDC089173 TaxID=3154965 RepID=UPI00344F5DCD
MNRRSVVAGIALAIVSVAPLSGVAHAQDLDCSDFRFQEDAQAEFNRDRATRTGSTKTGDPTTTSPEKYCPDAAAPAQCRR